MTIGANINVTNQTSKIVTVTATGAIQIVPANEDRTKLHFTLPLNISTMCLVVSETQAEADALEGELIGQTFPSNASIFVDRLSFDTDSSSQGEKWAIVDNSISGSLSTIPVMVNEYIA